MMVGELHCHTNLSKPVWVHNALPTPFELVDRAVEEGLQFVAITDHDTQEAFGVVNEYALSKGIVVIPAVEISSKPTFVLRRRSHILAYGVVDKVPSFSEISVTISAIHAQNGLAVAAHPFCSKFAKTLFIGHQVGDYDFDGIEIYNSTELPEDNAKSDALSRALGLTGFAGSDAHSLTNIGRARVTLQIRPTKDWRVIVEALRKGKFTITQRGVSVHTFRQFVFGHIWRKFQPMLM